MLPWRKMGSACTFPFKGPCDPRWSHSVPSKHLEPLTQHHTASNWEIMLWEPPSQDKTRGVSKQMWHDHWQTELKINRKFFDFLDILTLNTSILLTSCSKLSHQLKLSFIRDLMQDAVEPYGEEEHLSPANQLNLINSTANTGTKTGKEFGTAYVPQN